MQCLQHNLLRGVYSRHVAVDAHTDTLAVGTMDETLAALDRLKTANHASAVNAVITVPQVFSDGSTRRSAPNCSSSRYYTYNLHTLQA